MFGDEEGVSKIAEELCVRHTPNVKHNEHGTPQLSDIFERAQNIATFDILCYVNADIILMSDFIDAVHQIISRKHKFLMVGQRWDVEIKEILHFDTDWENNLRSYVFNQGTLHSPTGIDYFVFRRGLWDRIPPFALGRTVWDNWLLYEAHSRRAILIDATPVVMAIHQNHNISPFSRAAIWDGPEAKRNLELAGGYSQLFTIQDITHLLTQQGMRWHLDRKWLIRCLDRLSYKPYLGLVIRILRKLHLIP